MEWLLGCRKSQIESVVSAMRTGAIVSEIHQINRPYIIRKIEFANGDFHWSNARGDLDLILRRIHNRIYILFYILIVSSTKLHTELQTQIKTKIPNEKFNIKLI